MSCDKILQKKRPNLIKAHTDITGNPTKKKKYSPEERKITFVINSNEILINISTTHSLCETLNILEFQIPFYIKDNKEIILANENQINDFFHNKLGSKIYNYEYYTYFSQKEFEEQYKASQIDLSLNLKKLFFGKDYFYKFHLNSYTRLLFKYVNFTFYNFRDPVYNYNSIDVIELFAKSGLGISTYFFLYYQKFRNRESAKDSFIPYIIIDYEKLKKCRTINEFVFLLNFSIVNCFVFFNDYKKYSSTLFNLIKNNGINNIDKIIFQILIDIKDICKKNKYYYKPCIILDRYSFILDDNESFRKKLCNISTNLNYQLIIIYSLKEKKSNEVLYKYLISNQPSNYMYSYTDTLYTNIEKLPSTYPTIYSKVYPKITNFIKIQQYNNMEEAKEIIDAEKNEINTHLNNFYPSQKIKEFYINQLINLKDKIIDIKKNEDLFLNIPFEIFDFYEVENEKRKIILKIKSSAIIEVLENISNDSIIEIIKSPLYNTLNNYIKGGLVERAIIQIMKNNNSPFGEFKNVLTIDCFLNVFKNNKSYDFNKEERNKKIKNLKHYEELKDKYSNFNYNGDSILFIPSLSNAKEWDIAFVSTNAEGKIELCLIQISTNKPIKKIQEMLTNFENKKKYIKKKIEIIYGIKIKYINILFILSKQLQNKKTLEFLHEFQIPYIYFNHKNEIQNFLYSNGNILDNFNLGIGHHYLPNKEMLEKALSYNSNDDVKEDISFEEEIINSNEEEVEDEEIIEKDLTISDILNDQFQDGKID